MPVTPPALFADNLPIKGAAPLLTLGLGLCLGAPALAQSGTAPGEISRQVEPTRASELPALQMQPQRIVAPSIPRPGETTVRVQRWQLQGNELLKNDALLALLKPFTDVPVALAQIREAAAAVQQAYEDAGWLARVDLPQQDITGGTVRLQIVEARMGDVRLESGATSRVAPQRLQAWVLAQQPAGQPLHRPSLDRGLLLADDLPGVSVVGTLQASARPGATDVILNAAAEPPYSLDLSLDNHNARTVGAARISAIGGWSSPAGYGESYSAQSFKSEGSDYLRLGASAPLGTRGLRASVGLSQLDYAIVTPDADGRRQDIGGRSRSASLDLQYPLLRSRQANLYLNATLDERRYQGQANGSRNSDYRVRGGSLGLAGNLFDDWGGAAANSASLLWRKGQVHAGQVPVDAAVAGRYEKWQWNLSRQQALRKDLSLYAAISGQHTGRKALDGSENFSLGGPGAVRAYPVGEGAGPQGRVTSLELRWRLSPQWLITPFYDHGRIEKRTTDALRDYSLSGAGVSVTWSGEGGWTARTTLASRLGSNPNANQSGRDQDGSLHRTRLWLTLSRSL